MQIQRAVGSSLQMFGGGYHRALSRDRVRETVSDRERSGVRGRRCLQRKQDECLGVVRSTQSPAV